MTNPLAQSLLKWYAQAARILPWRGGQDAYGVWVSEVMLQQTRVETVIDYFQRWMLRFPDVETLANAELEEVLRYWEGLGYYRRAHNLHRAAREIMDQHDGLLPDDFEQLRDLPGIGEYTAAAILAIAFNQDVIAMDGNLRRVLSRLFDIDQDMSSSAAQAQARQQAMQLLPTGKASDFNQALMDLGALICVPQGPKCEKCPVAAFCLARQRGVEDQRPLRRPRPSIPHHTVTAGVMRRLGQVLIARRPADQLLGGLWEFPGGKCREEETLARCLAREWREALGVEVRVGDLLRVVKHAYTHFRVTVHAFVLNQMWGEPLAKVHDELRWVPLQELDDYPMGKVDRLIAEQLVSQVGTQVEHEQGDLDQQ